jgi:hypothetical protein
MILPLMQMYQSISGANHFQMRGYQAMNAQLGLANQAANDAIAGRLTPADTVRFGQMGLASEIEAEHSKVMFEAYLAMKKQAQENLKKQQEAQRNNPY